MNLAKSVKNKERPYFTAKSKERRKKFKPMFMTIIFIYFDKTFTHFSSKFYYHIGKKLYSLKLHIIIFLSIYK